MTLYLIILLTLTPPQSEVVNPYIGTWKCYQASSFNDEIKLEGSDLESLIQSTFVFQADSTYKKITNEKITFGRYKYKTNKLWFYERGVDGKWKQVWFIRWPKGTNDPSPQTEEIDLNFPELITFKKGNYSDSIELDVYYRKTSDQTEL